MMSKKEKVLQWLKDNGVLEQICKYSLGDSDKTMYVNENLIYNALSWQHTPEGFDFWHRICVKYQEWYYEQFPDEFLLVNFSKINY